MSTKKLLATNTLSQIVGKIITGGTTFLMSILIARTFGASGYGDFTKITTFVAIFYLFADFGMNAIFIQQSENKHAYPILFTLRVIASTMLMFLTLAILAFLPSSGSQGYSTLVKFGIILFAPTILFQSLITTANAVFQKHLRYELATIAIAIGSLLSLVIIWFSTTIFLPSAGIISSVIALALGSCVSAVDALWFSKKYGGSLTFTWQPKEMINFLKLAAPLGLTLFCNVIYFRADNIILTITRSTEDVGFYGFAYKLFEFPLVIPTFFMNAAFPILLMTINDKQRFIKRIKKSAFLLAGIGMIISGIGFFLTPYLSLVRPEFVHSAPLLRILLLGLPIFFLTSLTMWTLIAKKMLWQLFTIYIVSMVINVMANIFLTPTYGPTAAAWITVVSETLVLFASSVVIIKNSSSS